MVERGLTGLINYGKKQNFKDAKYKSQEIFHFPNRSFQSGKEIKK